MKKALLALMLSTAFIPCAYAQAETAFDLGYRVGKSDQLVQDHSAVLKRVEQKMKVLNGKSPVGQRAIIDLAILNTLLAVKQFLTESEVAKIERGAIALRKSGQISSVEYDTAMTKLSLLQQVVRDLDDAQKKLTLLLPKSK